MVINTPEGALPPPNTPFFHTQKRSALRASCKVRIRKERPTKAGLAAVYLQIYINGSSTTLPMHVSWPVDRFDNEAGIFLQRWKGDTLAADYNLQATKEVGKVNEIFIFYRHSDAYLTKELFQREINTYGARQNFIYWAELDVIERYTKNKIEKQSCKNDRTALKKIRQYRNMISFGEIDKQFLEDMQAWMIKRQNLKMGTVWRYMQTALTYIRRASESGIAVNINSVDKYKLPSYASRIVYLKPAQLQSLIDYYQGKEIPAHLKRTLGQFLFSCYTGLRFSDIERVCWSNIHDEMLVFEPYKTRKLQKQVRIPLFAKHFEFIQNERGKLFNTISGQQTNNQLKEIAIKTALRVNLTTHVARHTFATEALRKGGKVEVLQKLMGHKKIETTMVYVHVDDEMLQADMKKLMT